MRTDYRLVEERLVADPAGVGNVIWIDLLSPTAEEEAELEALLGLDLPTRDEMREIEVSSRLYSAGSAHFMTALIPAQTEQDIPVIEPVTFVLSQSRLITIRYHDPRAFSLFQSRAAQGHISGLTSETTLIGLLEVIVDRLADILETVAREIEDAARRVFSRERPRGGKGKLWQDVLELIGRKGGLVSALRDSLGTLDRMIVFFGQRLRADSDSKPLRQRLADLSADIRSLSDHANFVAQKVSFLLDATIGLIGIEQSGIIKIFSVVSVVFMPPTLVASVYGMNFEVMPELSWPLGYPFAMLVMVISAIVPYLFFRLKGWL